MDFHLKLLGWKGLAWLCSGGRCGGGSPWRDVAALLLRLGLGKAGVDCGADVDAMAGSLLPKVGCSGGKTDVSASVLSLQELTCACRC